MKKDLLLSKQREDNIVKSFAWFSVGGAIIGIVFLILHIIFKMPFLKSIYTSGLTFFILPFVFLQFFMSAGLYARGLGGIYFFFYLVAFPFVDLWFFTGINFLFNIVPDYHLINALEKGEFVRGSLLWFSCIYLLLNGTGLLWRIGKDIFKRKELVLLSL